MSNPFLTLAKDRINWLLGLTARDNDEIRLLQCSVYGFKPPTPQVRELVEWLKDVNPDDVKAALWSIDVDLETRDESDGYCIAMDQFMVLGLEKFLKRYQFTLKGSLKKQFETLKDTVNNNVESTKNTETYQCAYEAFKQAFEELEA